MIVRRLLAALLMSALVQMHAQTVALTAPRPRPRLLVGNVGIAVSPSVLNLTLVHGASSAAQPLTITTTVAGLGLADTLVLTAYFASTSALTTSGGDVVPSALVFGACSTCIPTSFTAFSQSSSFASASSLNLLNSTTSLTLLGGSRTDTLNLEVNLTGSPQTPAGSYSGTLVLAAQVF